MVAKMLQNDRKLTTSIQPPKILIALIRFQPAMTAINEYPQQLPKGHVFLKDLNELEKRLKIKATKVATAFEKHHKVPKPTKKRGKKRK